VSGIRSRRHTGFIWATPSGSRWATVDTCATARARPRVPPRPGPEATGAAAARPAGAGAGGSTSRAAARGPRTWGDAQPRSDRGDRRHHEVSSGNGVPSNAATCFCRATSASARSARFCHRLISRACSASFLSRGSTIRRTGPRFFGAPASSPRSRAARHVVRCEEYSPSRRSNAPTAPGVLQASASQTIPLVLHREPPPRRLRHHFDRRPSEDLLQCAHRSPILPRPRL